MKNTNPEFDKYIANAAPFARPILARLRAVFHKACPDVEEVMKWQYPHFQYHGLLASMGAFKAHARFGFWKQNLMADPAGLFNSAKESKRFFDKLTDIDQLPSDKVLVSYIKEAVRLNVEEIKHERPKKARPEIPVPAYFTAALKKNKAARENFAKMSPSQRREYVEWIVEAKQEATR